MVSVKDLRSTGRGGCGRVAPVNPVYVHVGQRGWGTLQELERAQLERLWLFLRVTQTTVKGSVHAFNKVNSMLTTWQTLYLDNGDKKTDHVPAF